MTCRKFAKSVSWNDVDLDGLTLCGDDVMDAVRAHLAEKEPER